MRHFSPVIVMVLGIAALSCKDRVICPAFQSVYIFNDSIRRAEFSLFGEDSLPKVPLPSRRTKYGMYKKYTLFDYHRKRYSMMTIPMENQLGPPAKDPLFIYEEDTINTMDEGEFTASDFADSLSTDSLGVVPEAVAATPAKKKSKYKYRYDIRNPYNTEQIYYNKYFGQYLVDNRPAKEPEEASIADQPLNDAPEAESDTTSVKKKKGFGSLFKRKNKNKEQESDVQDSGEPAVDE